VGKKRFSIGGRVLFSRNSFTSEEFMPRPPNYKQDKKRREEAQKRRNQEEESRKAERKNKPLPGEPPPA
jgi:hypothetical protein